MKQALSVLLFVALTGCGELVRPDGSASDASDASALREDARDEETSDASDAAQEAATRADASEDAEVSDVVSDAGRVRRCAIPEPSPGMELSWLPKSCVENHRRRARIPRGRALISQLRLYVELGQR